MSSTYHVVCYAGGRSEAAPGCESSSVVGPEDEEEEEEKEEGGEGFLSFTLYTAGEILSTRRASPSFYLELHDEGAIV